SAGGREVDLLTQVAHVVDATVGCGVDLDQVEGRPGHHLETRIASVARLRRIARTPGAVQRLGEQARRGSLTRAARTAEKVCVRDATGDDRALQGSRGGVLTHQVGKRLRAVLAVEGLVFRHQASKWPRTPASIEDPQAAPRFAARARMAAAPPGFLLTAASFRT